MKLNLQMIKEDLKDLNLQGHLSDEPWVLRCSFSTACTVYPDTFQENILYLLEAGLLPREPRMTVCSSILCIGRPPAAWLHAAGNFLYTENPISLLELSNRIFRAFARYQSWEDELQDVLDQHLPLHEIAVRSHSLIRNGIYVQGPSFQVLTWTLPETAEDTPLLRDYKKDFFLSESAPLPPDAINTLISDAEYNHAIEATEPAIYSGALYGFRSLFYNIRVNGVFVARICVDEVVSPLTDRDFALIKILGHYLGKGLAAERVYSFSRPKDMDNILHSLLSHRLIPEKKIHHVLESSGWNMTDSYICLILKLKTKDDSSSALEALALSLTQLLSSECYTIFAGSIVFVCNLTRLNMAADRLQSHILPHLRDNLLTAGTSSVYYDFKDLYYYYNQAETAYRIGAQKDATRWYFRFEDYQMDYLIYKLKEKNVPGVLIPSGLQSLMAYDRKKGTDYAGLLRIYLEKERNIAETIRTAYLHRNTFLYRIRKIQDILQMDLDQPDVRLILQIAFRVLDDAGSDSCNVNLL